MKYELTDQRKTISSKGKEITLYRIQAVSTFQSHGVTVNTGELGGFVQSERNLSQDTRAGSWIFDNACVYERAVIDHGAYVCSEAHVCGNAYVTDYAMVGGNAKVWGHAQVRGYATIREFADVGGYATVNDRVLVAGHAQVWGGKGALATNLVGMATLAGKASVQSDNDYLVVGPFGRFRYYFTFYAGRDRKLYFAEDTPNRFRNVIHEHHFSYALNELKRRGTIDGLSDVRRSTLEATIKLVEEKLGWLI